MHLRRWALLFLMNERNTIMSRLFAVKPLVIVTILVYTLVFVCTPQYSKAEDEKDLPKTVQGSGYSGYQTGEWAIPGAVSSGELIALGALAVVGVVVLIAVLNHKGDIPKEKLINLDSLTVDTNCVHPGGIISTPAFELILANEELKILPDSTATISYKRDAHWANSSSLSVLQFENIYGISESDNMKFVKVNSIQVKKGKEFYLLTYQRCIYRVDVKWENRDGIALSFNTQK
jgi:hypothetical protein